MGHVSFLLLDVQSPFVLKFVWWSFWFQTTPGAAAVEPCGNSKAAVMTVFMRLPGAEDDFALIGQTGVCFASVLAVHGDSTKTYPAGKVTRIRTHKRFNGTFV